MEELDRFCQGVRPRCYFKLGLGRVLASAGTNKSLCERLDKFDHEVRRSWCLSYIKIGNVK